MTIIGYTPAGFPITDTTPTCSARGCREPGPHDGMCGPHWWRFHDRRGEDVPRVSVADVAEGIAATVRPGETLTTRQIAARLRQTYPTRFRITDPLGTIAEIVLRETCTRSQPPEGDPRITPPPIIATRTTTPAGTPIWEFTINSPAAVAYSFGVNHD